MDLRHVACVCLLTLSIAVGPVAGQSQSERTVSGVAVELPADASQRYLEQTRELAETAGVSLPTDVVVAYAGGERWIVAANEPLQTGRITARGVSVPTTSGPNILLATSTSIETTGTETDINALEANPEAYNRTLVRVTVPYQQAAVRVDAGDGVSTQQTAGRVVTGSLTSNVALSNPASLARTSVVEGSETGSAVALAQFPGRFGGDALFFDRAGARWWRNGTATVDAVMINRRSGPVLHITAVEQETTPVASPGSLRERGQQYAGEVVSVRGSLAGTRLSSQETLEDAAGCAPDSVTVPSVGCVPVVTDVALTTGVLYDRRPDRPDDVIPVVGLSSHAQQQTATTISGQYEVTGRVVATDQLGSDLPGQYGLLVYDLRELEGTPTGGASEFAESVRTALRTQLTTFASESMQRSSTSSTPTATSTPASSPTSPDTSTPSPGTETRTETTTPQPTSIGDRSIFGMSESQVPPIVLFVWEHRLWAGIGFVGYVALIYRFLK